MANLQIDNGNFTRIHNTLLEELAKPKLSGQELQLILFVIRKTFGFQGKHKGDTISLSQIAKALNISSVRSHQILKSVTKMNIITCKNKGKGFTNFISFNKDYEQWTTKKNISTPTTKKNLSTTTKKNLKGTTKENLRHKRNKESFKDIYIHPLNKFINDELPTISKMKKQLTIEQINKLLTNHSTEQIKDKLEAMENYRNIKNYTSVYLTLKNWLKRTPQNTANAILGGY